MKVSLRGMGLLSRWEGGAQLHAYLDSGGALTIGVGHLLTRDELRSGRLWIGGTPTDWRDGISSEEAEALFRLDLAPVEDAVSALVTVPLAQPQFDALASFAFNTGIHAFRHSTLLARLNAGNYGQVPAQLIRWIYDGGHVVEGLRHRRLKEIALWEEA